ncbi:MAG: hypothetical protein WA584_02085 [Pyrinomonadaceae bacterium]
MSCIYKRKLNTNFDEITYFDGLSDQEFDKIIDHSNGCRPCARLIENYEKSVLPILRAALPDKTISYQPALKPMSWWDGIASGLRVLIIEITLLVRSVVEHSTPSIARATGIIVSMLFGGVIIFGAFMLWQPTRSNNPPTANPPNDITEKTLVRPVEWNHDESLPSSLSEPPEEKEPKKPEPAAVKKARDTSDVIIGVEPTHPVDNNPNENNKPNPSQVEELPATAVKPEKPVDVRQQPVQQPSKNDPTPPDSTGYTYVTMFPDLNDPFSAVAQIKATNLQPAEIDKTECYVALSNEPTVTLLRITMKKNGSCEVGLKIGFTYAITIVAPNYDNRTIKIYVADNKLQTIPVKLKRDSN